LLQYTSSRTRLFRKRQRRLPYALTAGTAAIAILGMIMMQEASQPVVDVQDMAQAAVVLPTPNPVLAASLKEAFEKTPSSPAYDYQQPNAQKSATLSQKIAEIHTGLNSLLQAGSDLFVKEKVVAVSKGDTLMDLLVKNHVPRNEAHDAIQALSKVYDPRDLNPGSSITVFFHQEPSVPDAKFSGLQIEKDIVSTVTVNREGDGSFKADQADKEVHRTMNGFRGTIDGSLYVSAKAQGVPDSVILDLIKMYSWSVDFQRDIQEGDKFEVMYEDYVTADGDTVPGKGNVLYAKLTLGDNEMPYYRYEDKSGDVAYYDGKGQSAKKSLMQTPIDGARISSGFGMRRHPVLGYSKMHKGVDFAAPRGTPIYAAGDGKIEKMGPFSSYGNYVRIRHNNGISTAYAHMKGFKSGLKTGSRIKQGQVIGYVGTTGRSTGPHLHYEVMMNGKQVNPKAIKMATGKSLGGKELALFKGFVAQTNKQFDRLGESTAVADASVLKKKTPAKE
jgi:murein DD-endopeptidase MepM/ murein hydrolase activator NlpD